MDDDRNIESPVVVIWHIKPNHGPARETPSATVLWIIRSPELSEFEWLTLPPTLGYLIIHRSRDLHVLGMFNDHPFYSRLAHAFSQVTDRSRGSVTRILNS